MNRLIPTTLMVALSTVAGAAPAAPPAAATAKGPAPAPVVLTESPEQAPAAPSAPAPAPSAPPPAQPAPAPAAPAPAPAAAPTAPAAPPAKPAAAPSTQPAAASTPSTTPVPIAAPPADKGPERPRDTSPIESRFNVRFDADAVWYTSKSFDLVSSQDVSGFVGVSVGYAVLRSDNLWFIPELGYSANTETASNLFGGAMTSLRLGSKNAYAGLSARLDVLPVLDVAARVSGGATFFHFEMRPGSGVPDTLSDNEVAPFFTVGGGATLHLKPGTLETRSGAFRSLNAGIAVEGGYIAGGSVELHPVRTDARIATSYMSLGNLERSGPYLKVSLVARF